MVKALFFGLVFLLSIPVNAQFATARLSKKKVVVQEPVQVKVTAYSPTWFAKPLSFDNLQVEGAFLQTFSRTVSGITQVRGKQYAILEFYFILFPYREGTLTFPSLSIRTSIPPEGGYKGQPVVLTTKPLTLQVDPVPATADEEYWLVANDVRISNSWSADIKNVRVGEVVKRKITIRAAGTLPTFINEPDIGKVDFASIYAATPVLTDLRDDRQANGKREDNYTYLLEEAGTFVVPAIEIKWWNPALGRYYSRKLPEYKIRVLPNDNLSALQQLKDSLEALSPVISDEDINQPETAMPFERWLQYVVIAILAIVLLWLLRILIKTSSKIIGRLRARQAARMQQEAYWFKRMMHQSEPALLLAVIYRWIDHLPGALHVHSLDDICRDNQELQSLVTPLLALHPEADVNPDIKKIKQKLSMWRQAQLLVNTSFDRKIMPLNP